MEVCGDLLSVFSPLPVCGMFVPRNRYVLQAQQTYVLRRCPAIPPGYFQRCPTSEALVQPGEPKRTSPLPTNRSSNHANQYVSGIKASEFQNKQFQT
jgi:hypothetical protein